MQEERLSTLDLCLNRQSVRLPPEIRECIKEFVRHKPLDNKSIRIAVKKWCGVVDVENSADPTERESLLREYGHISEWNVSQVTDFSGLFFGQVLFQDNLNAWDTRNAVKMNRMFLGCSLFNSPLNRWNTSMVFTMSHMFLDAASFNQPLNDWDTRNLEQSSYMFMRAMAFNQPLDRWNTGLVTLMDGMFCGASSFNQSLEKWNMRNVRWVAGIFEEADALSEDNYEAFYKKYFYSSRSSVVEEEQWNLFRKRVVYDRIQNRNQRDFIKQSIRNNLPEDGV